MQSDGNSFCGDVVSNRHYLGMKIPKDSLVIFLVLNAVFITIYLVKAVKDDISAKTFPI